MSANVTLKELLEAGVHYGHQCRRWNPKMRHYIFGARNGIHIIDLQQTVRNFKKACEFIEEVASDGGHVLFVGTKRQAKEIVAEEAVRCKMYFINNRWLGGTLTNFPTIRQSIHKLKKIEAMSKNGTYEKLTKKEVLNLERTRTKLDMNLGGIKDMPGRPSAIIISDAHRERIAIKEAAKLNIPVVAIADTNADPDNIDFVIPGNDDSYKSLKIFLKTLSDSIISGKQSGKGKSGKGGKGKETQEGTIYDQEGHVVKVEKK